MQAARGARLAEYAGLRKKAVDWRGSFPDALTLCSGAW